MWMSLIVPGDTLVVVIHIIIIILVESLDLQIDYTFELIP